MRTAELSLSCGAIACCTFAETPPPRDDRAYQLALSSRPLGTTSERLVRGLSLAALDDRDLTEVQVHIQPDRSHDNLLARS